MLIWIILGLILLTGGMIAIYHWGQRRTQRRALLILRWIETSLGTQGHVTGMRWLSPTEFEVPLKLLNNLFQRARIRVNIAASAIPFRVPRKFRSPEPESLTFQADLDLPPAFAMQFQSLRWFARSHKNVHPTTAGFQFSVGTPIVVTTRLDWSREVTAALQSILRCEHGENVSVVFRRTSPNFSATLPLESIAPETSEHLDLIGIMRSMAENASEKKA